MTEQVETVWTGGAEGHVGRIWGKESATSNFRTAEGQTSGCLADVAPTLPEKIGFEKPAEMTGESLMIPVSAESSEGSTGSGN